MRVGRGSIARTSRVFCAVTAVIAQSPWTPNDANVRRSAWMPAPPPESEPAIVSTEGGPERRALMLPARNSDA